MTSLSAADYDPVTPFRDPAAVKALVRRIESKVTRPWSIMEICGGQTHAIRRYGLDELLPGGVELIHGPGCPVCVTPASKIDRAVELSLRSDVLLCSYGDMIRVPGSGDSLAMAKARGGRLHGGATTTSGHRQEGVSTTIGPGPGVEDPVPPAIRTSWPARARATPISHARRAEPAIVDPSRSSVKTRTLMLPTSAGC